jgi:hypothetical protein
MITEMTGDTALDDTQAFGGTEKDWILSIRYPSGVLVIRRIICWAILENWACA